MKITSISNCFEQLILTWWFALVSLQRLVVDVVVVTSCRHAAVSCAVHIVWLTPGKVHWSQVGLHRSQPRLSGSTSPPSSLHRRAHDASLEGVVMILPRVGAVEVTIALVAVKTRKPCCRKETARWSSCCFGLKFADNIHYQFKSSQASKARLQSSKRRNVRYYKFNLC